MSHRMGLVQGCVVGAALTGAALVSSSASAQQFFGVEPYQFFAVDPQVYGCCEGGSAFGANAWTNGNYTSAQLPVYAPPAQPYPSPLLTKDSVVLEPVPYWWTHGEVELGYRSFTDAPLRDGPAYLNQSSLAKYYEYSTVAPGMFGGGHVAAGTGDGLYQVDLWANNIGRSDQGYWLDASKAGEHYVSVGWDQTPHVYSTSAQTPFLGVGTSALVLGPGFPPAGISTSNSSAIL